MNESYVLIVEIDAPSLRALAAAESRIVIARHRAGQPAHVAWLAFEPTGRDTVAWDERYGLYAAACAPQPGNVLSIGDCVVTAADRSTYPFAGDAFGVPASGSIPPGHVDVRNDSTVARTFGLLQSATINGTRCRAPLSAVVVPPAFTADFTGLTSLTVWPQSGVESGSIVKVPPRATEIAFGRERRSARCRYDAARARFVIAAVRCGAFEHRVPPPSSARNPASPPRTDVARRERNDL